jgi:anti-sigma-K factor RskA
MNFGDQERADAVAGEYVLGTLRGRARARFERLARSQRSVADALRGWQERLLPLAETLRPVEPPARVWAAILARIGEGTASSARAPLWARAGWWRGLALASVAVAVALAVAFFRPAAERPEGTLVVVLAGQDSKPALIAATDRSSRYLTVSAVAPLTVAGDRALELWMLPAQGNPRSLGLVLPAGSARVALPSTADQALRDIPALAISLEPKGGSPTGLPTGPVLYSGPVRRLY